MIASFLFPNLIFREMLHMEKFCTMQWLTKEVAEKESLIVKKEALKCSGKSIPSSTDGTLT